MPVVSDFRYLESLHVERRVVGNGKLFWVSRNYTVEFSLDGVVRPIRSRPEPQPTSPASRRSLKASCRYWGRTSRPRWFMTKCASIAAPGRTGRGGRHLQRGDEGRRRGGVATDDHVSGRVVVRPAVVMQGKSRIYVAADPRRKQGRNRLPAPATGPSRAVI